MKKTEFESHSINYPQWRELYILEQIQKIFIKTKLPTLPILYSYGYTTDLDTTIYQNKKLINKINKNMEIEPDEKYGKYSLALFTFRADYDMKFLMSRILHPEIFSTYNLQIMDNIFYQVMFSLALIQEHFPLIHFDLHSGNVLVSNKYKSKEKQIYRLNNNKSIKLIFPPGTKQYYHIWDFSRSLILDKDSNQLLLKKYTMFAKRHFYDKYLNYNEKITHNLKTNPKKYYNHLKSIDTLRFSRIMVIYLKNYQQKLYSSSTTSPTKSTSRSATIKGIIKKVTKKINFYNNLSELAIKDLTIGLSQKKPSPPLAGPIQVLKYHK